MKANKIFDSIRICIERNESSIRDFLEQLITLSASATEAAHKAYKSMLELRTDDSKSILLRLKKIEDDITTTYDNMRMTYTCYELIERLREPDRKQIDFEKLCQQSLPIGISLDDYVKAAHYVSLQQDTVTDNDILNMAANALSFAFRNTSPEIINDLKTEVELHLDLSGNNDNSITEALNDLSSLHFFMFAICKQAEVNDFQNKKQTVDGVMSDNAIPGKITNHNNKPLPKRQVGRPKNPDNMSRDKQAYEYLKKNGGSWNDIADKFKFPTDEAARKAVTRYARNNGN